MATPFVITDDRHSLLVRCSKGSGELDILRAEMVPHVHTQFCPLHTPFRRLSSWGQYQDVQAL